MQLALAKLPERGQHKTGMAAVPDSILTGGNFFAMTYLNL